MIYKCKEVMNIRMKMTIQIKQYNSPHYMEGLLLLSHQYYSLKNIRISRRGIKHNYLLISDKIEKTSIIFRKCSFGIKFCIPHIKHISHTTAINFLSLKLWKYHQLCRRINTIIKRNVYTIVGTTCSTISCILFISYNTWNFIQKTSWKITYRNKCVFSLCDKIIYHSIYWRI